MGKKYTEEFKKEVVREYVSGKSYSNISNTFDVPGATLAGWIKKYSEECQYTKPQNKESIINLKETRELQKKIMELEKENAFLKKAAAFFAKEID